MPRLLITLFAASALSFVCQGCGGGGNDTPESETPPAAGSPTQAESVSDLIERLDAAEPAVRLAAIHGLIEQGDQARSAIHALRGLLADPDAQIRGRATLALAVIGPDAPETVTALAERLGDEDPMVRAYAAYALGLAGNAALPAVDVLAEAITDPDPHVRREAVEALKSIHPGPEVGLPILIKVLSDADPTVVVPALHSLAEAGPQVVPLMIEALKDEKACFWACLVLADLGPDAKDAVPALAAVIGNEDPEVQMQALVALAAIGPDSKSATGEIAAALESEHMGVRYTAAYALGTIGAADASDALRTALENDDAFLQMVSAWALAKLNPDDTAIEQNAILLAIDMLKSDDPNYRRAAVESLIDLDPPPELVRPALIEMLRSADPEMRGRVVDAMAQLGAAAVPRAISALENEELRGMAIEVIERVGPDAQDAVPALVELVQSDDLALKREVVLALAAIGPASAPAVPVLVATLSTDDEQLRNSVCYALGKIGPEARPAVDALTAMLESDDPQAQLVGVWSLVQIQPENEDIARQAVPILTGGLDHEDGLVRVECANALGDLGALARSAEDALARAAEDTEEAVREAAAAALQKIRGA